MLVLLPEGRASACCCPLAPPAAAALAREMEADDATARTDDTGRAWGVVGAVDVVVAVGALGPPCLVGQSENE